MFLCWALVVWISVLCFVTYGRVIGGAPCDTVRNPEDKNFVSIKRILETKTVTSKTASLEEGTSHVASTNHGAVSVIKASTRSPTGKRQSRKLLFRVLTEFRTVFLYSVGNHCDSKNIALRLFGNIVYFLVTPHLFNQNIAKE